MNCARLYLLVAALMSLAACTTTNDLASPCACEDGVVLHLDQEA